MKSELLCVGRAYFVLSVAHPSLPIPKVETLVYVGEESRTRAQERYHVFRDPTVYYAAEISMDFRRFPEYERDVLAKAHGEAVARLSGDTLIDEASIQDAILELSEVVDYLQQCLAHDFYKGSP